MSKRIAHCAAVLFAGAVLVAMSTAADAAGKIVCWKDKSGKVVGCGDTVPPEYQQSATKELDTRGMTRKTTESAEEAARRRAQEQEQAAQRAEESKREAERKRQDSALLATFSNAQEIDAKRDRDLQAVDLQLSQLQGALKGATDRHNEAKAKVDAAEKSRKPAPQNLKEEVQRSGVEKEKLESSIAAKKKEQEEIRAKYADFRKRYVELKGPAASISPAAAINK